jgi:hypothetical protein
VPIKDGLAPLTAQQSDSLKHKLSKLTSAIFETSKWMLVNNRRK